MLGCDQHRKVHDHVHHEQGLPNNIVNGFLSVFHFLPLIHAAKTPFWGHFVRVCGVFVAPQLAALLSQHLRKILSQKVTQKVMQTAKICAAAKTMQNLMKCPICGVFAARISEENQKHQNTVFLRLPFVGY